MAKQKPRPSQDRTVEQNEAMNLLEAALYVAGRPLEPKTLGSIIKTRSKKKVQKLTRTLAQKYLDKKGALELMELVDGRFVIQLKSKYAPYVKRLSMRPLLSDSPLTTLAYIAYKQPVAQSQLAAVRGTQIYKHIKELKSLGLIRVENLGKTKMLNTTDIFADYFNLSHDKRLMKHQLKMLFDAEKLNFNGQDTK